MNRADMTRFRALFEEQRNNLLYTHTIVSEDFHILSDDLLDETDMTSSELETSMRMRLRNREALFLKKINEALRRIADGSFGLCDECGEDIEPRRLDARPTASCCVSCKEEQERREHLHIDGHRPKSLGQKLRLA
jgi:DnaK suppressor protein